MHKKLREDQPTTFGTLNVEETQSMYALKEALMSPQVRPFPNSTCHMTLNTDICTVQLRDVLLQQQMHRTTKPLGYCSRSSTDTEHKYDQSPRECLAIV